METGRAPTESDECQTTRTQYPGCESLLRVMASARPAGPRSSAGRDVMEWRRRKAVTSSLPEAHLNFLSLLYLRALRDIGNGGVSELSVTHARAVLVGATKAKAKANARRDETLGLPIAPRIGEAMVMVMVLVVVVIVVDVVVAAARFHALPDAEGRVATPSCFFYLRKLCSQAVYTLARPAFQRSAQNPTVEEAIMTTEYSR
ncbi:hypothetical protein LZ554_002068 [Drepanopeziza brunnea f. sp. 'monogermtubi']|nr:hypothetical protein LZ554_002068 [Drepanopeziza brunnea f. sp. 'monogermtubi']